MPGEAVCNKCGGTGDRWNVSLDDWTTPRKDCLACDGGGYARDSTL